MYRFGILVFAIVLGGTTSALSQEVPPKTLFIKIYGGELAPGFRFHDLCHAAASLFIEVGMPPKRLCQVMGHSSIQVTFDLYGHLWPDDIGDAAMANLAQDALFVKA